MKFMRHSFYFYINKNLVLDIDSAIPWQIRNLFNFFVLPSGVCFIRVKAAKSVQISSAFHEQTIGTFS